MKRGPKPEALPIRLERYTNRTESGCWLWTGAKTNKGYGVMGISGKPTLAHRVTWELNFGPIPDGMFVCHRCDVRPCINPSHLFLGTNADNMADAAAKKRVIYGPQCPAAKLTAEKVREIRARVAAGELHKTLAAEYGVVRQTITSIAAGKAWRRA